MRHLFCLLLFIFVFVAKAQDKTTLDLEKIDRYLEKTQKDWNCPGFSIGVIQDGKLVFSKGYGQKEAGKPDRPDANTLYAPSGTSVRLCRLSKNKKWIYPYAEIETKFLR